MSKVSSKPPYASLTITLVGISVNAFLHVFLVCRRELATRFYLMTLKAFFQEIASIGCYIMKFRMFAMGNYLQVLKAVVKSISVYVMNVLFLGKFSPKVLFHKPSMLKDQFTVPVLVRATDNSIATSVKAPVLKIGMLFSASILGRARVLAKECWAILSLLSGQKRSSAFETIHFYGADVNHVLTFNPRANILAREF